MPRLRPWDVQRRDGRVNGGCLCAVRRREVQRREERVGVHRLRRGDVPGDDRGEHGKLLRRVRGRQIKHRRRRGLRERVRELRGWHVLQRRRSERVHGVCGGDLQGRGGARRKRDMRRKRHVSQGFVCRWRPFLRHAS